VLLALFVGFVVTLANRPPLRIDVIRDRNQLYRETAAGRIENVYELKVLNKTGQAHRLLIEAEGLPGINLATMPAIAELGAGEQATVVARVSVDARAATAGGHNIVFRAIASDNAAFRAQRRARFMMPPPRG
jgi:polyferredoxin